MGILGQGEKDSGVTSWTFLGALTVPFHTPKEL
jgi:hypothetical protein